MKRELREYTKDKAIETMKKLNFSLFGCTHGNNGPIDVVFKKGDDRVVLHVKSGSVYWLNPNRVKKFRHYKTLKAFVGSYKALTTKSPQQRRDERYERGSKVRVQYKVKMFYGYLDQGMSISKAARLSNLKYPYAKLIYEQQLGK